VSVLAALLLAAWPASAVAQSEAPASPAGVAGGPLIVEVPDGAAPAGTTITVVSRDPAERPEELRGVPMERPFHELEPADVRFTSPATVTRSITFQELGIDTFEPTQDGLILAALLTRDVDGTWTWLPGTAVRLDRDGAAFIVTATIDHGGPILTSIAGDLLVATEDATETGVREVFRVEGQLRVDPASGAAIATVTGATSDESIAVPGESYVVEGFERAAGLTFVCLAPGTVRYEATFSVTDVADVGQLNDAVDLTGTDVTVTASGEHTCA
jgi:hypothetical protein